MPTKAGIIAYLIAPIGAIGDGHLEPHFLFGFIIGIDMMLLSGLNIKKYRAAFFGGVFGTLLMAAALIIWSLKKA